MTPHSKENEMATENNDDAAGAPKRSSRYPAFGLDEAITKVGLLYKADKGSGSVVESALKHMGYKSRSGPANQCLATLKRFGLISSDGSRVTPTKRAITICVLPTTDKRRVDAIQEAALLPSLYRKLYDQYKATGLPSSESMQHELILSGDFNSSTVASIVKDFKTTMVFSGLTGVDGVISTAGGIDAAADSDEEGEDNAGAADDEDSPRQRTSQGKRRMVSTGMKEDVCSLGDQVAVLQWPEQLDDNTKADLKDWLDMMVKKINRAIGVVPRNAHSPQPKTSEQEGYDDETSE